MDELTVRSTSKMSAEVSDIVLRETTMTRLVFQPMLVDNPREPAAAVKGTFIYQRKGKVDPWENIPTTPLNTLKKGEGYCLALDSTETLSLFSQLNDLYRLHAREGIPIGVTEFVRAEGAMKSLSELDEAQLRDFLNANQAAGSELISRLLRWVTDAQGVAELVALLEKLGPSALGNLNTAVSVSALTEGLAVWNEHHLVGKEEFWHNQITTRSFLLEQLFSWPCSIIANKAYVGGKTIENGGGGIVDFLVHNRLTTSAALIEIKTPTTPLLTAEYRNGIPNISRDLSGSVVQVLSYKASLNESYLTMRRNAGDYEIFDPPCVVIIGNTNELTTSEQRRSFELFRRQLKGIEVITFDELFGRVEQLIKVLDARTEYALEETDFDPPF